MKKVEIIKEIKKEFEDFLGKVLRKKKTGFSEADARRYLKYLDARILILQWKETDEKEIDEKENGD